MPVMALQMERRLGADVRAALAFKWEGIPAEGSPVRLVGRNAVGSVELREVVLVVAPPDAKVCEFVGVHVIESFRSACVVFPLLKQHILRGVDARLAAARRGGAVGGLLCGFLFSSRRLGAHVTLTGTQVGLEVA